MCSLLQPQSLNPFTFSPSSDWMRLSSWDDTPYESSYSSPSSSPLEELTYAKIDFDNTVKRIEQQLNELHQWMDAVWRDFGMEIRNLHSKNNSWGSTSPVIITPAPISTSSSETRIPISISEPVVTQIPISIPSLESRIPFATSVPVVTPIPISVQPRTNSTSPQNSNSNPLTSNSNSHRMRPEIVELEDDEVTLGQVRSPSPTPSLSESCYIQNQIESQSEDQNRKQIQIQNKKYRLNINLGDDFPPESINVKVSVKNRVLTIEAKLEETSDTGDGKLRVCREFTSKKFELPPNLELQEITSTIMPDGILVVEAPLCQLILPQRVKITEIPIDLDLE